MKKYIVIEADTNDGDYITNKSEITDSELEVINPVIQAIKNFKPYQGEWMPGQFTTHDHNFPLGDCLREDMGEKPIEEIYSNVDSNSLEVFKEMVPYGEYGIHTIKSIEIVDEPLEKLL